ncbi:hypothetical protein LINGRAHAP2_LOCUS3878 [Linum grandiflorum]
MGASQPIHANRKEFTLDEEIQSRIKKTFVDGNRLKPLIIFDDDLEEELCSSWRFSLVAKVYGRSVGGTGGKDKPFSEMPGSRGNQCKSKPVAARPSAATPSTSNNFNVLLEEDATEETVTRENMVGYDGSRQEVICVQQSREAAILAPVVSQDAANLVVSPLLQFSIANNDALAPEPSQFQFQNKNLIGGTSLTNPEVSCNMEEVHKEDTMSAPGNDGVTPNTSGQFYHEQSNISNVPKQGRDTQVVSFTNKKNVDILPDTKSSKSSTSESSKGGLASQHGVEANKFTPSSTMGANLESGRGAKFRSRSPPRRRL